MTRDELIEAIREQRDGDIGAMQPGLTRAAVRAAYNSVLSLAEQLDSPTAMTWQRNPILDHWHWIEGVKGPRVLRLCRGEWRFLATKNGVMRPLNGRRVCPILAPPELPKRGDA